MAQNDNIYQSLLKSTISHLDRINELKKQVAELQIEVERKENELLAAKREIKKLKEKLNPDGSRID
jgi:predicted  nucleic acid-binding Zn-ribbon protein